MVEGFKQTDIGLIPNDWTLEPYTEIASLRHGFQFLEEHFSKIGIGVIKIGNLKDGAGLNLSDLTYVPFNALKRFEKVRLKKGDVLMALTGATLGKVCMVNTEMMLLQNYRVGNFIPNEKTTREFIYQICQSEIVQKVVKDLVNSGAQPNLGKKDFDKIFIPLPPTLAEQTAIATALNDADTLINQLEQLLTKKRNIKTGVMQELLKPKEGWKDSQMGNVFDFKQGVQCPVEKQYYSSGNRLKRFIRIVDLTQKDELPRYILDPGSSHHIVSEDLFMVRYGNPGLVGYGYEGVIANNLFRLLPKKKINSLFFYHLLQFKNSDILNISSSTTMAALNFTALRELDLVYPDDLTEQARIAEIFYNMANEIQALEKQLDKYKMMKQGMMQSLLTGKIRLV